MDKINKHTKLSRYTFLFAKGDEYFIYSTKRNNFYKIDAQTYTLLRDNDNLSAMRGHPEYGPLMEELETAGLIATPETDDEWLLESQLQYNLRTFSSAIVGLTIVPTISCNLRCPYCFEQHKPAGVMSDETIKNLVTYISRFQTAKAYSITWFGGEPLLAIDVISTILEKLESLEGLERGFHSIITNGTLLTDKAIGIFKKFPLHTMQITLDGNRHHHDKKRFFADQSGTFDVILNNVESFMHECPDTHVSFRINIDKETEDDFAEIVTLLRDRLPGNHSIYPGILRANRGCESETFFTSADHLRFNRSQRQKGIALSAFPEICNRGCCATNPYAAVIGPKGETYRCWEHVGHPELETGNISTSRLSNATLFRNFIMSGHNLNDSRCRECGFLPICNGGCPNKRVDNLMNGTSHELCTIYHDSDGEAISDLLYEYYLTTQTKQQIS